MRGKVRFLSLLVLGALALATLTTCKPVAYYLGQVYKAYGKVVEDKTLVPLESVEVFLHPYQYSVLTNGLGDYGIELSDGTWTLDFVKDGYVTQSKQVTVSAGSPRFHVPDVVLVRSGSGPGQASPFGTWAGSAMSLTTPGGRWSATNVSWSMAADGSWWWCFTGADNKYYWMAGTFLPAALPTDTDIAVTVTSNNRGDSTQGDQFGGPSVGTTFYVECSGVTTSALSLYVKLNPSDAYQGPFQLQRQEVAPVANWTYVGTWVNSAYNGLNSPYGKMVLTADTLTVYLNDSDSTPLPGNVPITVNRDYSVSGAHNWEILPGQGYMLVRVSNSDKTLEITASPAAYPSSIDTGAPVYWIWMRQ